MYSKNKIIKLANQAEYTVKGIYFIVGNGIVYGLLRVNKPKL
jgi:hypothetical protein